MKLIFQDMKRIKDEIKRLQEQEREQKEQELEMARQRQKAIDDLDRGVGVSIEFILTTDKQVQQLIFLSFLCVDVHFR